MSPTTSLIHPIIRKGLEDVMINAENLPRVIYQLKEKYPDKFFRLESMMG